MSERALRPAVLGRIGSFGSDSDAGSRFAERLLTVVATCRQQRPPLLDCLVVAGEAALGRGAAPSFVPAPRESLNTYRALSHPEGGTMPSKYGFDSSRTDELRARQAETARQQAEQH